MSGIDRNTKSVDIRVTGTSRWAMNKRRHCLSYESLELLLPTCTKIIRSDSDTSQSTSFTVEDNTNIQVYLELSLTIFKIFTFLFLTVCLE